MIKLLQESSLKFHTISQLYNTGLELPVISLYFVTKESDFLVSDFKRFF